MNKRVSYTHSVLGPRQHEGGHQLPLVRAARRPLLAHHQVPESKNKASKRRTIEEKFSRFCDFYVRILHEASSIRPPCPPLLLVLIPDPLGAALVLLSQPEPGLPEAAQLLRGAAPGLEDGVGLAALQGAALGATELHLHHCEKKKVKKYGIRSASS